jgi:hypothetical protein
MDIPAVLGGDGEEGEGGGGGAENTTPPQQQLHKSDDENNPGRPAKKDAFVLGRWGSVTRHQKEIPELSAECLGSYIAPDGKIYVGVGKVVGSGLNANDWIYVYVEPIPGKQGSDYDFYDEVTLEYMPDFTNFKSPKGRYPWREKFTKSLNELVPKLGDNGLERASES